MNIAASKAVAMPGFPCRRLLASIAGLAILACSSVQAQIVKTGDGGPQKLFITILDGDGALNNIRQRDAREPVVQVTDENHKPVAGAALLFLIHSGSKGAGADFHGASSFATTTGPDGVARTTGLQVGRTPGTYTITVTATLGAVVATSVIHQGNIITALNPPSEPGNGTASTTGAQHGVLHMSKTAKYVAGSIAVGAGLVAAAIVTQGNRSTGLALGSSTVGHP